MANTDTKKELVDAIWATVKRDSLASSRIGQPGNDTNEKLVVLIDQYATTLAERKMKEAESEKSGCELEVSISGGINNLEVHVVNPKNVADVLHVKAAIEALATLKEKN